MSSGFSDDWLTFPVSGRKFGISEPLAQPNVEATVSHLRSFPFDKLKIDQSFVRDLPQRRNCEAIVGAVARLASSFDMTMVAERVET